jgi:hypothetical protein
MKTKNRSKSCPLCGAVLAVTPVAGILRHPASETCQVVLTDADGISIDESYVVEDDVIYELLPDGVEVAPDPSAQLAAKLQAARAAQELTGLGAGDLVLIPESPYISTEWALEEIFKAAGVPRLGGASGDRGWSSISTFQRCPYLWKMRYQGAQRRSRDGNPLERKPKSEPLEIGTILHTFQAITLAKQIDSSYPLEPDAVRDALIDLLVTPEYVHESWRIITAYWANYRRDHEEWVPLAVEHHLVDPKTGESCRIDAIMWQERPLPGRPAGTYLVDHKSAARFDYATLHAWKNDGEIIGLVDLYDRLKVEKRFGPLRGVCINILGKQKDIQFHREWVFPKRSLIIDHRRSLRVWSAAIDTAKAASHFPRARNGCRVGFGSLCDFHDHCAFDTLEDDIMKIDLNQGALTRG